jgi:hypothetical protein
MFKLEKNDKSFKELAAYAEQVKLPLKEMLLSDTHLDRVASIFYKHMPKMVKWSMKEEKFKEFYKQHRESLVAHIKIA